MNKDQKAVVENKSYQWGSGEEADSIRTLTSSELTSSIKKMMVGHNSENGVWVFGYGSLLWNPDFKISEIRSGAVSGYHRRLCIKSIVYRGTPDYHGLVFGLDHGGSCQGMTYRIEQKYMKTELQKVWEREMFAETYIPTWVCVKTNVGNVSAITFVINPQHEHYVPDLELEEVAERVIRAEGKCGTCHEYVQNTVKSLNQYGLRDPSLEQLLTLIKYPQNIDNLK